VLTWKKLSDDAENNTAVDSAGSNNTTPVNSASDPQRDGECVVTSGDQRGDGLRLYTVSQRTTVQTYSVM